MILWLRYFRNLLLRNLQLKVVSLTLAVLLWIALIGEPKSEIGLKVPLEFRNSPKGVEVLGETNTVDIRLSASSSIVKRIDASEVDGLHRSFGMDSGGTDLFAKREQPQCSLWRCRYQNHSKQDPPAFRTTERKIVRVHPESWENRRRATSVTSVVCSPTERSWRGLQAISPRWIDFNRQPRCFRKIVNLFSSATPLR
jgi:hypothetical protein